MVIKLTPQVQSRISDAIAAAEARTSGEIFCVLARQVSSFAGATPEDYVWTAHMWANISGPGASNSVHVHPGMLWAAGFLLAGCLDRKLLERGGSPLARGVAYVVTLWCAALVCWVVVLVVSTLLLPTDASMRP